MRKESGSWPYPGKEMRGNEWMCWRLRGITRLLGKGKGRTLGTRELVAGCFIPG